MRYNMVSCLLRLGFIQLFNLQSLSTVTVIIATFENAIFYLSYSEYTISVFYDIDCKESYWIFVLLSFVFQQVFI